ncbi:hypothetical protein RFI_33417 [Reticulomyxa filosa]|uniref:Uncharacterized protein n=1 Tax=Reticulomyxa filosa TaxID=46433 RepID=X6LTD0_RETFI|nr:hypothetical protein RFI_33417 [Reticulomyxa filosa]|eukprot:ETO03985.1 hypothetical protein RFI_33417 [Reticulomyxa filosa]
MNVFQMIPTGFYVCLGMALAWTIPKYKDHFGIREETLATLKIGLIGVVAYFFVYVLFRRQMSAFVKALLFTLSCFGVVFSIVMRSTWWILRKQYASIETHLRKANIRIVCLFVHPSDPSVFSSPSLSRSPSPLPSDIDLLDLVIVLKDVRGFELFMEHLFSGTYTEVISKKSTYL